MTKRKKRWIIGSAVAVGVAVAGLFIAASMAARRFEPFLREQTIRYMSERFGSEVALAKLKIHMPKASPLKLWLAKGHGAIARVEGEGISMRFHGDRQYPPLFSIAKFQFDVDLGTLWERPVKVRSVVLDGVEINIPPKGDRPKLARNDGQQQPQQAQPVQGKSPAALIENVRMTNAKLRLIPKDASKVPLEFAIYNLRLDSAGLGVAMKYHAVLTNPKPPGHIDSYGTFGPWVTDEPANTPLAGKYTFENANLGVFAGIEGILKSTGQFDGNLASINASGEAYVPDFRLEMAGNPVPLKTKFEVLVDGTNGNTILQPVRAVLGQTTFTTSGAVIKHEGDKRRTVVLDVDMPHGHLRDILRLAMKGSPFMEGGIALKTKIGIPPLSGKVREKLILDGRFRIINGKFLKTTIQDQIDSLSRRGQGQPKNEGIDEVVSNMAGVFRLENEVLTFRSLGFSVPGAAVQLAGDYNLGSDVLDFHGALRLDAKVSQTMTGWKRWALKPVDPFFAKHGAGTFLKIQVTGDSRSPKFGLDRGGDDEQRARKVADR